jgi:hypothetical protein
LRRPATGWLANRQHLSNCFHQVFRVFSKRRTFAS